MGFDDAFLWSSLNHTPIKYRCSIKNNNQITATCLIEFSLLFECKIVYLCWTCKCIATNTCDSGMVLDWWLLESLVIAPIWKIHIFLRWLARSEYWLDYEHNLVGQIPIVCILRANMSFKAYKQRLSTDDHFHSRSFDEAIEESKLLKFKLFQCDLQPLHLQLV